MTAYPPHGTRARYVREKPKCALCRAANSAYQTRRTRQRAYGRKPFIDATPARDHIRQLQATGMGRRRVAELAGLAPSVVTALLYGRRGHQPTNRIRPDTAAAILAVEPGHATRVPALGARRRLQALVALGHPQARLARALGMTAANFGAMLRRDLITERTDTAVRALYEQLSTTLPAARTACERQGVTRATRHAAAQGWPPPLAWDEGQLDDPAAQPAVLPAAEPADTTTVDDVAIDRVLAGQAPLSSLTRPEQVAAAGRLATRGATTNQVAKALGGIKHARAKGLVDEAAGDAASKAVAP